VCVMAERLFSGLIMLCVSFTNSSNCLYLFPGGTRDRDYEQPSTSSLRETWLRA